MNNPIVKLDLDSIIQCWFGLWTKSTCSLILFLSVAFNRICFPFPTVYDCVNWQRPRIEIHQSPHLHWPQFEHRVTLITGSKMAYSNSLFGFELQNSPALGLEEKEEKTKLWGRLSVESVVLQKTVIESTFDYWIETEYKYWIVHFMNGFLNEQTKSFSH